MVFINGKVKKNIKAIGKIIKGMEKGFINGKMVKNL